MRNGVYAYNTRAMLIFLTEDHWMDLTCGDLGIGPRIPTPVALKTRNFLLPEEYLL